jgi:hypothetical protein
MRIAATAAVFGSAVFFALAGGQPPAKDAAPKVLSAAKLIADLGADDYRTRENAGKGLTQLGEKALPEMRKALETTDDPEVSRRLTVLVRKIDHDRLVAPKRVTLSMKDKPVKVYLDEITKQTGYTIDYSPNGSSDDAKHAFEFDNAPFWVAIDQIANATGMMVYADSYDDASIRMYAQDSLNPHVCYAGPFRFLATQISSNKNVQLSNLSRRGVNGNARAQDSINLSFQIQSEPKNPILGTLMTEVISATDDTGASLVAPKDPNNSRSHYYSNMYRTHNAYANLQLVRIDKNATTIKSLKAKTSVVLLSNTVPEILVNDPLKVKNKKFVGRTAEIDFDNLTEANGQYTLTLTAKKLGASDDGNPDYNWSNSVTQKMELYDAKGNKFRNNGANSINNNGSAVTVTLMFSPDEGGGRRRAFGGPPRPAPAAAAGEKPGAPVKFVFNEWISATHEVTFEFKNLPLP